MYAKNIEKVFKRKGIEVGDRIRIKKGKESYEGILMPRIELGDNSCLIIKLDNGYNIGTVSYTHLTLPTTERV